MSEDITKKQHGQFLNMKSKEAYLHIFANGEQVLKDALH